MFLRKLALLNFKNHTDIHFEFTKKVVAFTGNNGVGKTNILDSIYYLCLTKSYFNTTDQQNIRQGSEFFRIEGDITRQHENFNILYKLMQGRKKELLVNDIPVIKLGDHIGKFPAVIITPDDNQLVLGGSEERRRFLDSTLSQVNTLYLEKLILYNKLLTQRNALLKRFAESGRTDKTLLDTYNVQLAESGQYIYQIRKDAVSQLEPVFQQHYATLSLQRERVRFEYESQLHGQNYYQLLDKYTDRDIMLQRTDCGIHKDDLSFYLGDSKLKKFGSQGQQKTFVISLKLAEYSYIKQHNLLHPILLIDDIYDKLDEDRSKCLSQYIMQEPFKQVFITHTSQKQVERYMGSDIADVQIFAL